MHLPARRWGTLVLRSLSGSPILVCFYRPKRAYQSAPRIRHKLLSTLWTAVWDPATWWQAATRSVCPRPHCGQLLPRAWQAARPLRKRSSPLRTITNVQNSPTDSLVEPKLSCTCRGGPPASRDRMPAWRHLRATAQAAAAACPRCRTAIRPPCARRAHVAGELHIAIPPSGSPS
jgi:hypothetical protein